MIDFPVPLPSLRTVKSAKSLALLARALCVFVCACFRFSCDLQGAVAPPGALVAWGSNSSGQTNFSAGVASFISAAAGEFHSLALQSNGTVIAFGSGPATNVPAGAVGLEAIACGRWHCLGLKTNHTVIAWGKNDFGQTNVPAGLSNVIAIAGGGLHSLALRSNGTVTAWGAAGSPQSTVPAGLTNVSAIAAGYYQSLAVQRDGRVVAWGAANYGVTNVPAGLSNVVAVAAGYAHSLALRADGTIVAWGDNSLGQTNVPASLTNAIAVAAGYANNLALTADGSLVAWGDDTWGQNDLPRALGYIAGIASGYYHCLATTPAPWLFSEPPSALALPAASSTNLVFSVLSAMPLAYQWRLNGGLLPAATQPSLTLTNFNLVEAGLYALSVSNLYGSITGLTIARLTNSPVILIDEVDIGGGLCERVDSAVVSMSTTFASGASIYFTLDGTTPDFTSLRYTQPLVLSNSATFRALAYDAAYLNSAEAAPIQLQIRQSYRLLVSTPGGGTISVTPPGTNGNSYMSGTFVTLSAVPWDGWEFLNWAGDATGTNLTNSLVMDRPRNVQAVFGRNFTPNILGSGQVLLNPAAGPYPFGSIIEATAVPAAGAYFFGWGGSATGFENPVKLVMTNAIVLTSLFGTLSSNQVSLTVATTGNGHVEISPFTNVYLRGQTITVTAIPGTNSIFGNWSGDATGQQNPLTLVMSNSMLLAANFLPGVSTNPPIITRAPESRTISPGTDTVLSVQAGGSGPLFYQWAFNTVPISGATQSSLLLSRVAPGQAGIYQVMVTNLSGSVTSAPAALALFSLQLIPGTEGLSPLLVLNGPTGSVYRLDYSRTLSETNWNPLATLTLGNGSGVFVEEPVTNRPASFYRAKPF